MPHKTKTDTETLLTLLDTAGEIIAQLPTLGTLEEKLRRARAVLELARARRVVAAYIFELQDGEPAEVHVIPAPAFDMVDYAHTVCGVKREAPLPDSLQEYSDQRQRETFDRMMDDAQALPDAQDDAQVQERWDGQA